MSSNKGLGRAYLITIVLLAVGVVCYAAFPVDTPENPVRMMFKNTAGKVLFTHKLHADVSGYALSCLDCHHHYEEDGDTFRSCGECHGSGKIETVPTACLDCHEPLEEHHPEGGYGDGDDAYSCSDCHQKEEGESVPQACADCHDVEDIEGEDREMNFQKRSDAIHTQCIGCHEEYGSGPVECSSCHTM